MNLTVNGLTAIQKSSMPTAEVVAVASRFGSGMKTSTPTGNSGGDYWGKYDEDIVRWRAQEKERIFVDPRSANDAPPECALAEARLTILPGAPWVIKDIWRSKKRSQMVLPGR